MSAVDRPRTAAPVGDGDRAISDGARLRAAASGAAPAVVATWLVSRVLVAAAAVAAENLVARNPRLASGSGGPVLSSLTSWDG